MKYSMGFFDSLFGEKITMELPDENGQLTERTVTRRWVEQMKREGLITKVEETRVRVHVLAPTGYTIENWNVGDDMLSQETYDDFHDADTGDMYLLIVFEEGERNLYFVVKSVWEIAKEKMDAIG